MPLRYFFNSLRSQISIFQLSSKLSPVSRFLESFKFVNYSGFADIVKGMSTIHTDKDKVLTKRHRLIIFY